MKKIVVCVMTIFFVFISSFNFAFAEDDIYYGKFFDQEYYIIPQIPNISLFSNLDGFSVSYYVFNYATNSGWLQYYDTCDVPNYKALTFYEEIKFPKAIESGKNFDFSYSVMASTVEDTISDFYRISFMDNEENFLLTLTDADPNVVVSYNSAHDEANLHVKNITLNEDCYKIRVFHRVQSHHDLESGAYVRNIGVSAFNETNLLTDIFKGISSLPGNIANSISKFFELEDDTVVNENESLNSDLNNAVTNYDQIEGGFVDDLNTNISNLDTNINMFDSSDFIATSNFLSDQMTTLYSINPNIQNMITFSLIIGLAFVVIGIGVKR